MPERRLDQPSEPTERADPVRSVLRSLRLMEALADGREMSLTSLAEASGLRPSTTHRLLATLASEGYVGRGDDGQRYRLGHRVAALARSAASSVEDLREAARPTLLALRDDFDETANLIVLDGASIVYIDQVESRRPVRMFTRIGNRVPAHASGGGKALLASLTPDGLDQVLRGQVLERLTTHTITSREELDSALDVIRRRGWATDDREYDDDVICVAAAFPLPGDPHRAAITVSGPAERMLRHGLARLGEQAAARATAAQAALN
ncbi:MAG: IclR family transcriptional regulator [Solirubrobacterales bacterium]